MKSLFQMLVLLFVASTICAQTPNVRDQGVALLKQGDSKAALAFFKNFTKQNSNDHLGFHYLGVAATRENKFKDAEKAFERAVKINPDFAESQTGLAYIYLRRDKLQNAAVAAEKAISLDANNAESYYILGSAKLRLGDADGALENAEQAIKRNPNFATAYLLKAHSLISPSARDFDYKERSAKYGTAADNIGKFIILSKNLDNAAFWQEQRESLRFFADYYTEKQKAGKTSTDEQSTATPIKIIAKPHASYTDRARGAGISGFVRLLVAFSADGQVKHMLALNSLGGGLDEEAVKAAKNIKFEPATQDGKAVTVVKVVEYSFVLY